VRFVPGSPGESDRPLVTSPELARKAGVPPVPVRTTAALAAPAVPAARAAAAATPASNGEARLEEARRAIARLEVDLREAREAADDAEGKVDASLKAIYERDVQVARLEAQIAAHETMREGSETFVRHLEARLDKTESRAEEKEHEIRRLAVGLGEARGEIRLLTPPKPEAPPPWKRRTAAAFVALQVTAGAGLFGWVGFRLASSSMHLEAGIAAAFAAVAAFTAGWFLDRVRRSK
jgi:hypothetical protein